MEHRLGRRACVLKTVSAHRMTSPSIGFGETLRYVDEGSESGVCYLVVLLKPDHGKIFHSSPDVRQERLNEGRIQLLLLTSFCPFEQAISGLVFTSGK